MDGGVTFNAVNLQLLLEEPPQLTLASKVEESRKAAKNLHGSSLCGNIVGYLLLLDSSYSNCQLAIAHANKTLSLMKAI